ncbi:uncharacterized protein LOC134537536 isoform X4 [Bacillus rossius redtenbacheri]|uniref:uncharacterized protein LOC134537536 isoform X4 n=1 Tax=Bacillus rossius redtenbacheri TaxID=93214 RepID=UPI002FDD9D8C
MPPGRQTMLYAAMLLFHVRRIMYTSALLSAVYVVIHLINVLRWGSYESFDREQILRDIAKSMHPSSFEAWKNLAIMASWCIYSPVADGVAKLCWVIGEVSPRRAGGQACRHPPLEVHNRDIMKFMKPVPPIDCGERPDWVRVNGSTAYITDEARARQGIIECAFTDIIRGSDHVTHDGVTTQTHTEYHLEESDFVKVHCKSSKGEEWHNVMAGVRHDQEVKDRSGWDKVPRDALRLNVLMWGFDSLSHNMFIRKLPRSYHFLRETLGLVELHGYNIVGDGTPQALIPILTGKTELELPETRKRMGDKASYVNIYPFVWKDYQDNGYVTAFMEDCPNIGTFTYRLRGFDAPPTDHYMRPFYVAASSEFRSHKKFCLGSVPRHKVMMDYVLNLFRVYRDKPKFAFAFHGELSHDSHNQVGAADQDMLSWLTALRSEGHLNNTLLVVMSDHGSRFEDVRNTQQGKQEERMPMFGFVLPRWVQRAHPELVAALRLNARRLTSPFDIHPTLLDVLHYSGGVKGDIRNRSISLFKEVPLERTCANAFIEPHWCACLEWQEVSLHDDMVKKAAKAVVKFINEYTSEQEDLCAPLYLDKVTWAARLVPNHQLLNFRRNADMDGFVADLSAHTPVAQEVYQLKLATSPGGGLFEVSVRYDIADDTFATRVSDISRINRYGSAAHCVEASAEHLRKYCYCKTPAPADSN